MKEFDLVVVGSGAGLLVLEEGLRQGWSCALVESGPIGGTCLNRGCIPSKVLAYPADLIREAERAVRVGLDLGPVHLDWDRLAARMWRKIGRNEDMEQGLVDTPGLTLFRGTGEFTGDLTMRVLPAESAGPIEELRGRKFVLATGARSVVPPIPGLAEAGFVTSESFFGEKFPRRPWTSLVLVGGGTIAAEFAHIFSAFGTKVIVVEMLPRLLAAEEPEVSALVETEFRKRMDVRLNARAAAARAEAGRKAVVIEDGTTGERSEVEGEEIFVAVGRRSNADRLKPEASGVRIDRHGWIVADEFLQTSRPGVWALGDALGGLQFRHKANHDAEVLIQNIFGPPEARRSVGHAAVPWAVFTHPQVGHVGLTEREALAAGFKVSTSVHRYSSVAKGFAMGYDPGDTDDGLVKMIVDGAGGRILGAHIVGPQASILVQPFVYLMDAGAVCPEAGTYGIVDRSMVIHPALSEVAGWAFSGLHPVETAGEASRPD